MDLITHAYSTAAVVPITGLNLTPYHNSQKHRRLEGNVFLQYPFLSDSQYRDSAAIVFTNEGDEIEEIPHELQELYVTKRFCKSFHVKPVQMKNTTFSSFLRHCYINPEQRVDIECCVHERHPYKSEFFIRMTYLHCVKAKILLLPIREKNSTGRFVRDSRSLTRSPVTHYVIIFSNIQELHISKENRICDLSPAGLVVYLLRFTNTIVSMSEKMQLQMASNILQLRLDGKSLLELSEQECWDYLIAFKTPKLLTQFWHEIRAN